MDVVVNQYQDEVFQEAFKRYFGELGVKVTRWGELFAEMSEGPHWSILRKDGAGKVIGFLMYRVVEDENAFFSSRLGFIEEFWVAPEVRSQGHGGQLFQQAEAALKEAGCAYVLLTTETAEKFYLRRGYAHQPGIRAKNSQRVFAKVL